jgi:nucleotide-binding universal stress UspA family protein
VERVRNILVATDLTTESESVLIRSIQLSKLSSALLHVLHVTQKAQLPQKTEDSARLLAETRDQVRSRVCQYVISSDFECEVHIESRGRVYEAIVHHAQKVRADLVMIGRTTRPYVVPSSVLLTTSQVIVNAHCPVLVVSQPVSGNYVRILLETNLSTSPEKILTPVRDFGPDIRVTLLRRARAEPDASTSIIRRFYTSLQRRKHERFAARATAFLQQRGLSPDRMSIDVVRGDYDATLLSKLNDKEVDVVGLRSMHQKLRHRDSASHLLAALQAASCDILAMAET